MAKQDLTLPLLISAGVHIGVIALFAAGVNFDAKPPQIPQDNAPVVEAIVVDQQQIAEQVQKIKQERLNQRNQEQARQRELEYQANQAKEKREREQQQIQRLAQERKQQEQAAKKAEEQAKIAKQKEQLEKQKAAAAEEARKLKEAEKLAAEKAAKLAQEKRKQEEAAAKKAEMERQRIAQEKERKEQELQMQDALAAEHAALAARRNQQVISEVQRYTAMIKGTIERNLVVNESMRGKNCRVNIRLAKDGFVTSIRTLSGDPSVCRAAESAINKAGRLPVSSEIEVYNKLKVINLTVQPEFK